MRVLTALTVAFALACPGLARAQDWPVRPVRLIVPYPPGGNADVVGRIVARALQGELGQPFVIENKAGAGGLVGGESAARSAPDGYTFLLSANGPVLYAPELADHRPYDWRKDFAPIATMSLTPLALLVHPAFPARTIAEFVEVARRDGDKLNFAAAGAGTSNHLFSELIQSQLGLHWTTVQYKGTAPAMTDLIGGHVEFSIDQISSSLSLIRDGKVRALAVSSAHRLSSLPEIPTFVENGYTNLEGYTFVAVLAPARTPDAIVRKFATAIGKVVHDPEVARQIAELGAEPAAMSPEEFRAYLEKEDTVWLPIVRATKPQ